MHKNSQSVNDNLSTSRSSCKRSTHFAPFNLSWSNRRTKGDNQSEIKEDYKFNFKARKIPKTHKVPFMVYYSTKSLTSFNSINHIKSDSNHRDKHKTAANSTYDQCRINEKEPNTYSKPMKIKSIANQNQIKFEVKSWKYNKENQQVPVTRLNPQRLTDYEMFEPLMDNTNIKTFDNRERNEILYVCCC